MSHVTWQETAEKAGIIWEAEKRPLWMAGNQNPDLITGPFRTVPGRKALVRSDTGAFLSVVSDHYRPIQPARIFTALEPIRELTGGQWAEAREYKGGQIIGGTLTLPGSTFEARPGDEIVPNVVFLGGFSGNLGVRYFLSSLRLWCLNVLARLLRSGARQVSVRHTGDVERRMENAGQTVGEIIQDIAVLRDQIRLLTNTPATPTVVNAIIQSVLPEPKRAEERQAPLDRIAFDEKYARWEKQVDAILGLAQNGDAGVGNGQGTAWDVVNGVTHYVDHIRSKSKRVKDAGEYIAFGQGALAKGAAFEEALRVAA